MLSGWLCQASGKDMNDKTRAVKYRHVRMRERDAELVRRADGSILVSARMPLGDVTLPLTSRLDHWAAADPDRMLFADRGPDGNWRKLSYGDARRIGRNIAQSLLARGLSAERPIVILSGNDIEHAMIALGAMYAGVPFAPVSPAYSLLSSDHAKLRHIFRLLQPGLVYVSDARLYEKALASVMQPGIVLAAGRNAPDTPSAMTFEQLTTTPAGPEVDAATGAINGDTIAKFLFTSGSTGLPKAVINTHGMWCCNQEMIRSEFAFMQDEPPIMLEWLPWNHTAGGNHNFGITIYNGGSTYIDDGNPTPAGMDKTIRNLMEIAPTLYFNVPKGYEALCEHMRRNERLRRTFFSRLKLMQYAGAGLAQHVWDALEQLAVETCGERIVMISGFGSTETAPAAFYSTQPMDGPGNIGTPVPGVLAKLVPADGKLEVRLKGPSITPGYWRQPELTAAAFDEEGFYRIGDALAFVDEADPNKGFRFDGRIAEDFKLDTGTWVNMAGVRGSLIAACAPYVRDVVLAGHDRGFLSALVFPDPDACGRIMGLEASVPDPKSIADSVEVRALFQERLDALAAAATGSSTRIERIIVLPDAPAIDTGEMTDKGSINQRAVLQNRKSLVEDLYAEPAPAHVIVAARR